jgi:hypothetical protein
MTGTEIGALVYLSIGFVVGLLDVLYWSKRRLRDGVEFVLDLFGWLPMSLLWVIGWPVIAIALLIEFFKDRSQR